MELENVVARLAQQVERRYYGKYRGFVVDNADPEQLGRLKLTVPSVLGDEVVTGWALPCVPYGGAAGQGSLFIPDVDAGVWVEFEEGDLEFPIWTGTFWSKPGGESELPKPNDVEGSERDSVQDPPTRKIIKTSAGHTIQFEDGDGEVRVILSDGQQENRILFSSNGLTVVNKENTIEMTDSGVTVKDKSGNAVVQDESGVLIEDKNGNTITMDRTSGGIPGTSGVAVNGGKKVCLEGLINWLMSHTHVGNMGAPCPLNPADMAQLAPLPAAPDGNILSKKVTLG